MSNSVRGLRRTRINGSTLNLLAASCKFEVFDRRETERDLIFTRPAAGRQCYCFGSLRATWFNLGFEVEKDLSQKYPVFLHFTTLPIDWILDKPRILEPPSLLPCPLIRSSWGKPSFFHGVLASPACTDATTTAGSHITCCDERQNTICPTGLSTLAVALY